MRSPGVRIFLFMPCEVCLLDLIFLFMFRVLSGYGSATTIYMFFSTKINSLQCLVIAYLLLVIQEHLSLNNLDNIRNSLIICQIFKNT